MEFQRVEVNSQYRTLRLLSQGGRWELGLSPYHRGMRVRLGRAGGLPKVLDCCLGRDESLYGPVLLALVKRFEGLDEMVSAAEMGEVFPWEGISPDISAFLTELLDPLSGEKFLIAKNLQ